MEWKPIETRPDEGEFLAWDPIAKKADVCVSSVEEIYGYMDTTVTGRPITTRVGRTGSRKSCRSTQSDGEYGPEKEDFQGERATLWCAIEPPND